MRRLIYVVVMFAALIFIGVRIHQHNAFETDILSLLPASEQDPVRADAADKMHAQVMAHTVFLLGHSDPALAQAAADVMAKELQHSTLFERVIYQIPEPDSAAVSEFYARYSGQLLSAEDRRALSANDSAYARQQLLNQLYSPLSVSMPAAATIAASAKADGHLLRFMQSNLLGTSALQWRDGHLRIERDGLTWFLIDLSTSASAFDQQFQLQAAQVFKSAEAAASTQTPDINILRTGTLPYAIAARTKIEKEINIVSSIDTVLVLLLLWLCLRRFYPLALMASVIGAAFVIATAGTLLLFGRVHIITFVFGTTLIGIAGDYALHVLVLHASAGTEWNAQTAMRHLRRPLTMALLTTLLAYLAITLTPFTGFRQMAVFCMLGLLAAYAVVVWVFPEALRRPCAKPARGQSYFAGATQWLTSHQLKRKHLLFALLAVVLVAAPGWWQLRSDDDIHALQTPDKELQKQQKAIAKLLQQDQAGQFFLVRAKDQETLLQREEQLRSELDVLIANQQLGHYRAVSQALPSQARQRENFALNQAAWRDGAYAAAWAQAVQNDELSAEDRPQAPAEFSALLPEQFFAQDFARIWRAQWLGESNGEVLSVVALSGVQSLPTLAAITTIDGVAFVDETASISAMFASFRQQASALVAAAYIIVLLVLWRKLGMAPALMRVLPTIVASAVTLALLGYLQQPINLFHGVALMLVLGIGVDYAMFLADGEGHEPASLMAIVLSAGTALIVFGLLSFSHMPAVAGFGLTVAIGVFLALLLAPMVLLWRPAPIHS